MDTESLIPSRRHGPWACRFLEPGLGELDSSPCGRGWAHEYASGHDEADIEVGQFGLGNQHGRADKGGWLVSLACDKEACPKA
jgi:hypothetical protein